jgi:RNA polymerase sigma-70 factor (ECF subfamily)
MALTDPTSGEGFRDLMARLRRGDDAAAATVFQEFVARLIRLTRRQLATWIRRKVDPEGLVQSVYRSFFARYQAGQFTVADWESLWGLLAVITLRKCVNQAEHWQAARRDVGQEVKPTPESHSTVWQGVAGREPAPDEAAILAETLEQLVQGLSEREREILALHLQGWEIPEISRRVGRAERTVRRTLELARKELCRLQAADEPAGQAGGHG